MDVSLTRVTSISLRKNIVFVQLLKQRIILLPVGGINLVHT